MGVEDDIKAFTASLIEAAEKLGASKERDRILERILQLQKDGVEAGAILERLIDDLHLVSDHLMTEEL